MTVKEREQRLKVWLDRRSPGFFDRGTPLYVILGRLAEMIMYLEERVNKLEDQGEDSPTMA